jgi:hypothetical protein
MKKYKCLASHHHHSLPQQRQAGYFWGAAIKESCSPVVIVETPVAEETPANPKTVHTITTPPPITVPTNNVQPSQRSEWPTVIGLRNDSKNANEAIITRDMHIEELDAKLAALKLKLIAQHKAT